MTQPRTYPHGVTSWIDLEQPDVDRATEFYGAVLGWTFQQASPPGAPSRYLVAQVDGLDAAGIGGPADEGADPGWRTYVAVDDVAAALDRVAAAGGTIVVGPTVAGEGGTWAQVADPSGAVLRLWQARRRLGAQAVNANGAWNFSNLHAAGPATAFYAQVFGWEFDDAGFGTMIKVPGYGDHLAATTDPDIYERQASVDVPAGFADAIGWLGSGAADELPHWHVTFAVADRDATAARVTEHGGQVLSTEDTDWTRDVTVRDPQGAVFTASQLTPPG